MKKLFFAPVFFFLPGIFNLVFSQTVVDVESNEYRCVFIGNNIWMAENLHVKSFRNGDVIFHAQSAEDWILASQNKEPAWCYYEDENGLDMNTVLYNWFAVTDSRGIAPLGCHVPDLVEWASMIKSLGGLYTVDEMLKSEVGWEDATANVSGKTGGFDAYPVGSRYVGLDASFYWDIAKSFGKYTNFWTTNSLNNKKKSDYGHRVGLSFDADNVINDYSNERFYATNLNLKGNGFSVRCVLDENP